MESYNFMSFEPSLLLSQVQSLFLMIHIDFSGHWPHQRILLIFNEKTSNMIWKDAVYAMRHSKTTIKSPCCLALIVFVELSLFLKNNRFSLNLLARMVVIQRNMPNLQTISLLTCFCTSFVSFFFTLCYELPIFPLLHVHTNLLFNRTILEIIYIIIKEQSILLQRKRFFMILSNIREDLFWTDLK